MLEKLLFTVLGVLLASLGYFVRRRLEQKPVMEHIEKNERLLELKHKLESSNVSVEDLSAFEDVLLGRAKAAARISIDYERQAEAIATSLQQDNLTQSDMNQLAVRALHLAEGELDTVIDQISSHLSGPEIETFLHSHNSWLEYRDSYAQFVADKYSGGSIQPLVHASALEAATAARISELKLELENRQL